MVEEAALYSNPEYVIYSVSHYEYIQPRDGENVYVVKDGIFDTLCDTKSPQGVLAVMKIDELKVEPEQGIIVALEDVQNPLNVGTIIRTADALGAAGILLSSECADVYSPKVLRGTMGSIYHLPIVRAKDFHGVLMGYKQKGFTIAAGDLRGGEVSLVHDNCVLVVGNEGNGISQDTRDMCDVLWRLNMPGKAESLNAAVAMGIMLYTMINS